ncbi:archaellin/type IV pilin N-terminal domain-containing protein [Nitrosopumilus sp.]|uniref:archaellin/type IV pilin N-terminal domain-containing protein n=1 Tax=Nitrosopumilus sp. TaxID=2024843 RepID=UPI00247C67B7|nr:archaellin/type IV pilin N-terminal domain-containing protein [Nitrosopumilus sp.]MCV0409537.1 flagellin [Nitrosopumilus sp.]
MKLQRKGTRHAHRGVIGVESAIVMIAFVIVAAALAFVVLNMGFTTSQKAKTTIIAGLGESSSSMQVAGKVIGVGCTTSAGGCSSTPYLNATAYPIKITSGGDAVDLSAATTAVRYLSNAIEYDDVYAGPITATEYRSLTSALDQADAESSSDFDDFNNAQPMTGSVVANTAAFIYWSVQTTANAVLDQGEHAVLVVAFEDGERPTSLDTVRVEIIPATGASLSVERQVPTITTSVVDLG